MRRKTHFWIGVLALIPIGLFVTECGGSSNAGSPTSESYQESTHGIEFSDARSQAVEFIGYDDSIDLTLAQENIDSSGMSVGSRRRCWDDRIDPVSIGPSPRGLTVRGESPASHRDR